MDGGMEEEWRGNGGGDGRGLRGDGGGMEEKRRREWQGGRFFRVAQTSTICLPTCNDFFFAIHKG